MKKNKLKKALKRARQEIKRLNALLAAPRFDGTIDQVRIFRDTELTNEEIQQHYEQDCKGEGIYAPDLPKEMVFQPISLERGVWYSIAGTYDGTTHTIGVTAEKMQEER